MSTDTHEIPADLGNAGRELLETVLEEIEVDGPEYDLLMRAARAADELVILEQALRTADPVVITSHGQPRVNELFAAVRAHRAQVAALVKAAGVLGLSDDDEPANGESTSDKARRAARARWGTR